VGSLLTSGATMMCPHGASVSIVASNQDVTLGGEQVLLSSDTFTISGCSFMIGNVASPCMEVAWQMPTQKCSCGGTSILTTDSLGMCKASSGAPQGVAQVQATQTKADGQ
jgi:hypothetical protein